MKVATPSKTAQDIELQDAFYEKTKVLLAKYMN